MAELATKVHDIIHPSPPDLQETTCIVVAKEFLRWKLIQCRMKGNLNKLEVMHVIYTKSTNFVLPKTIDRKIKEYFHRVKYSLDEWLRAHFAQVFSFHHNHRNDILKDFDDFVYDWDGLINYVHTAKRMILCDRLSDPEKFKIASMYSFEDDVRKFWPSVSEEYHSYTIDFHKYPLLFYWIYRLKNELNNIPPTDDDSAVDEFMIDFCPYYNWSSMKYFWNRIRLENRFTTAADLWNYKQNTFIRYILPEFNAHEVDRFVAEKGSSLIHFTWRRYENMYALPTWEYIKDKMSESHFRKLVEELLWDETNNLRYNPKSASTTEQLDFDLESLITNNQTYLKCEIWKKAPNELKRSVTPSILQSQWLFDRHRVEPCASREVGLLFTVLLDATFQERSVFWHKNWLNLLDGTRGRVLRRIMSLCFRHNKEIMQFKLITMSNYEIIQPYCTEVLKQGYLEELDDLLRFCCPETPTRRETKQRLLKSNFLGENSSFSYAHLGKVKLMDTFITDAYDTPEQAAEFKNQMISSPAIENCLIELISRGSSVFPHIKEFITIFAPNDEVEMRLKKRFVDALRSVLIAGTISMTVASLQDFLSWCLDDDVGEITKFKKSFQSVNTFILSRLVFGQ